MNNNISLIQLSNYVAPDIQENVGRKWVTNGKNNNFYQYIIDRYNGSPTNESVINVYNSLLYGRGIVKKGSTDLYDELNELFSKNEQRKALSDFKKFGLFSLKLVRSVGGGVASIKHFPIDKLAMSKADDKGNINSVFYSFDWNNPHKYKPEEMQLFKGKMTEREMILLHKPYQAGNFYFAYPDYMAALQYCEIEEEISNFSINHIKNGLSFGYVINMNNGGSVSDEQKNEIERRIKDKLTGSSNAGKFILSFNDGKEAEVTVTSLDVNDAHNQWESLRDDAKYQILTSHGVTSPLLFGISTATGFGSNADELDTASKLLQDYQITPKQEAFLDAIKPVLEIAGLETDLEFLELRETYVSDANVIEPIVEDNAVEQLDENVNLNSHICMSDDLEATVELADHLISFGEDLNEKDWYLLAVNEVDYETDDIIYESLKFATSTGVARPNAKSAQDSDDIVIRYRYVGNPAPQREFCLKMMFANKLYRKEDILQMEKSGINDGFGLSGSNVYSIWKWKGGGKMSAKYPNGTCKHKWQREIYLKRGGGVDVNSPLAKQISVQDARRRGYSVPSNNYNVGITPHQNKS
jgi:hypothetical protein